MSHTVTINNLQDSIFIDGKEYFLLEKTKGDEMLDRIESLTNRLKEKEADLAEMKSVILSVLDLLGILNAEKTTIREEIQSGEESYFKYILKALNSTIMLITKAQFSKGAEKEMAEKFAFIKNLIPIINKYSQK